MNIFFFIIIISDHTYVYQLKICYMANIYDNLIFLSMQLFWSRL